VSKKTEGRLNNSQKSQVHVSKGPLKDSMLDDISDFTEMDKVFSTFFLCNYTLKVNKLLYLFQNKIINN
jgi:hypothetical protein